MAETAPSLSHSPDIGQAYVSGAGAAPGLQPSGTPIPREQTPKRRKKAKRERFAPVRFEKALQRFARALPGLVARRNRVILNKGETKCAPASVLIRCRTDQSHKPRVELWGCNTRNCSTDGCRDHVTHERNPQLRRLHKALTARGDARAVTEPWAWLVLTFPPKLLPMLRDPELLREVRALAFRAIEAWLLAELPGCILGAMCVVHPEGDKTPGEWKAHLNFGFPLLAFGNDEDRSRHVLAWFREDLEAMKDIWHRVLEALLRRPLRQKANVWYGPERQPTEGATKRKIAHNVKYMPRGFPGWAAPGQKVTWHGAFGAQVVNKHVPELAAVQDEAEAAACKTCGGPVWVEITSKGWLESSAAVRAGAIHRRRGAVEKGPAPPAERPQ